VLLQVLDDGRLTDNKGRTVSFKNTLMIMTSNLAADYIQQESSRINDHNRSEIYDEMKHQVLKSLRETLRPEFLNRIDETIVFAALTKEEIRRIVRLQLSRLQTLLTEREIKLVVTDTAVAQIAENAYDPMFGARPIKRYVNKELSQEVAKMLLSGSLKNGQTLNVDSTDGNLTMKGSSSSVKLATADIS
jgi:ATP-dependent Clp protease ATP-binding subunit ClpB